MNTQCITLVSGTGKQFLVIKEGLVLHSTLFSMILTSHNDNEPLKISNISNRRAKKPLSSIKDNIMSDIVKFCNNYHNLKPNFMDKDFPLSDFDRSLFTGNMMNIIELMLAAHYLEIQCISDLSTRFLTDYIYGRSNDELRKMFNLDKDFTDKQVEDLRKQFELSSIGNDMNINQNNNNVSNIDLKSIPDISVLFRE